MNKGKLAIVVCGGLLLHTMTHATTNIDVMVVFSSDTNLSTFERTTVAGRYQVALSTVFGGTTGSIGSLPGQLDNSTTMEVWPLLTEVSYAAANKDNADALQWMIDENADKNSAFSMAREALGNPGADIILMVVPETTDDDCGAAGSIPLLTGVFHSESKAFAVVYLEDANPTCPEEIVVPHEVGHLLYAEHETDTNNDNVSPHPSNHAMQSTSSDLKSLMWDGVDPNGTEYLSGWLGNMTSSWADNVEFMSSDSFEVVSKYRKPPPSCSLAWSWNGCNAPLSVIVTAELPGYTVTHQDIDQQWGTSGPWYDIFEGVFSCIGFNPSTLRTVRAILTTPQGNSDCQIVINPPSCNINPW